MSIKYFDDIHSIRKEIRRIESESKKDSNTFSSIKRILLNSSKFNVTATDIITTRGDNDSPGKPDKNLKVTMLSIENLSKVLHDRQERQQLAEHILFLLKNNFSSEDGAVIKKLTDLSQQLVEQTNDLATKADTILADQGAKLAPRDFKNDVEAINKYMAGEFDVLSNQISVKYYVGVDKVQIGEKVEDRFYNMAYLYIKGLKGSDIVRDLYIVVTRRVNPNGGHSNFVRTFYNYVSPTTLMKNNIGTEFSNVKRAFEIIVRSLKLDKFIDVMHPSQIPVKKDILKVTNTNIINQVIDENNGSVKLYLNPNITTSEAANKILQDVFVEIKNIVKSVYPRNRNPIKATIPKLQTITSKDKNGKQTKKQLYTFKILFSKPETKDSLELPRDKVAQFMKILDISNPDAAKEFNRLLKNYMGIAT